MLVATFFLDKQMEMSWANNNNVWNNKFPTLFLQFCLF